MMTVIRESILKNICFRKKRKNCRCSKREILPDVNGEFYLQLSVKLHATREQTYLQNTAYEN